MPNTLHKLQETVDLVRFTEEILMENFILCPVTFRFIEMERFYLARLFKICV